MRLRVILPSLREVYPDREVELRTNTLQKFCGSRTDLEIGFPAGGVATYKKSLTWKDFEKTIPEYLVAAKEAEEEGFNGVMVHCVYDPGYDQIRRALSILVVGFGQSVFDVALQITDRFAMIAPNDSLMKEAYDILDQFGIRDRMVHMEPLNVELPDAHESGGILLERAVSIAKNAKEKGAGLIIPFGLALIPTHLQCEDIREGACIAVLSPAEIGIRQAEIIMAAVG